MTEITGMLTPETVKKEAKRHSFLVDTLIQLVKKKPLGTLGAVIVLIFIITGVFADLGWLGFPNVRIAPYEYSYAQPIDRLQPPSAKYILGTDNLGRDILSRIIFGARISMTVGLGASLISLLIATTIGVLSGYFGGATDLFIQRFVDAFMCFPPLMLIMTIMSVLGVGMIQITVVLGILSGTGGSRVVRSAVLSIRENVYVQAGVAIGAKPMNILSRHIIPNIMAPLIVLFTINIGSAIIAEATISFLGFGIPPPAPSWGGMLAGSGRTYMLMAPWMALWSGLALAIVVYGINIFGDAIRDLYDPRLRGGLGRYSRATAKLQKKVS